MHVTTPGLQQLHALERQTKRERPTQRVGCSMAIGSFVADIRRHLNIRQIDLATRARVGRHFLMALEAGKQSCEIELVLRTLETLGFEVILTPYTPIPPWIVVAQHTAKARRDRIKALRNQRRNGKRELERSRRLNANAPHVIVDLE